MKDQDAFSPAAWSIQILFTDNTHMSQGHNELKQTRFYVFGVHVLAM